MLACLGDRGSDEDIPLKNVTSKVMTKIMKWINWHKNDPIRTVAELKEAEISAWDMQFMQAEKKSLGSITQLICAANYLDIKGLYVLSTKFLGNMMKGKSAEEIRATFNIPAPIEQNKVEPTNTKQIKPNEDKSDEDESDEDESNMVKYGDNNFRFDVDY